MTKLVKKDGTSIVTAKDLGFTLPIGVIRGGGRDRSFSLKEHGYDTEKALGEWKKLNHGKPTTAVVTKLIALLLDSLGGEPFEHLPGDPLDVEAKKLGDVSSLYSADVFYIYSRARIEELGNEYITPFVCEKETCNFTAEEMIHDLDSMEVTCVEDISELEKEVPLVKGIRFRDGSIRKKLIVSPMLWHGMDSSGIIGKEDELLVKLYFISKCVTGVEGNDGAIVLLPDELKSLRKIDIEILDREINSISLGPSFVSRGNCPECNDHQIFRLDWSYNHFFGVSSLPTPGKKS
ncbi:MAG: hypothetical protein KAS32_19730 [Candidatus Peribacteraceae bacterium]|nr:hypothetical protein [Candidatus Peribacteraceae bacterium]